MTMVAAMRSRCTWAILAMAIVVVTPARSGHESPVYPSFYPHEIELAAMTPDRAAGLLLSGKIQAYVGNAPRFAAAPPGHIGSIESLGSFVIVRVNPASPKAGDEQAACAVADAVVRGLAARHAGLVAHPFPVTPFNGDYLDYVDLAEAAKTRVLGSGGGPAKSDAQPKLRTGPQDPDWDAEITEVRAADLVAGAGFAVNAWSGPAWLRTGWFQAYLLLGQLAGDDVRRKVEPQLRRLESAAYDNAVERINLQRALVSSLAANCRVRIAGYTVRREYFSSASTGGIENISYDPVTGFNAPMFVRTVKLKDFPWNGWLALGIDAVPAAAWNPIAGFNDDFGRMLWSAAGDPGLIPSPYDPAWMFNRISDVQSSKGR
ncbi:MAG TPA: hypothetical protein VFB29_02815 [Pseudolabrys sp.]|nr:hypothetical protein [Pseudolabrys sp.]